MTSEFIHLRGGIASDCVIDVPLRRTFKGDDDSYFQGKFMTYTPRIPPDMDMDMFRKLGWPSRDGDHKTLEPNSKILGEHLRMVNFQLYQARADAVGWSGTVLQDQPRTFKELVKDIAIDNAVIVTWANNHYYDFAKNFAAHMRDLGITNFLIGAMDKQLLQRLEADGVPTWLMGSKGMDERTVQRDFGWGTHNFHKMGRDKIRLIRDFTRLGIDVLISDIDVAWIANPLPFFRRHPEADILVSTDQLRNESVGDGLEFHICQTASNIGIMWFRSTPGAQAMTQEWVDVIEKDPRKWDQVAFNDLKALGGACQGKRDPKTGLMPAYNNKVKMGILPIALFSNGHTFYVQRLQ
eukprot:gene6653-7967_t